MPYELVSILLNLNWTGKVVEEADQGLVELNELEELAILQGAISIIKRLLDQGATSTKKCLREGDCRLFNTLCREGLANEVTLKSVGGWAMTIALEYGLGSNF